jgi:hypothetical protein
VPFTPMKPTNEKPAEWRIALGPLGVVVFGTVVLAFVGLQTERFSRLWLPPKSIRTPQGSDATTAAAGGSSFKRPSSTGSCNTSSTTSGFPYIGNDVFFDYAHMVFSPGSSLSLKGPSILFLHPPDVPSFAATVPQLQQKVVLVSNSNLDECLPWAQGSNEDSWRPHVDAILNSSMVVSWWVRLGVHATCIIAWRMPWKMVPGPMCDDPLSVQCVQ